MPRPNHFEIHADDPARAQAFYEKTFGWTFQKWAAAGGWDYWLVMTGPDSEVGINGGMIPRRGERPVVGQAVNAFVCTVGVSDLDSVLSTALTSGAALALAKRAVPGVGWMAYLHDTEGNILGLMQEDRSAK